MHHRRGMCSASLRLLVMSALLLAACGGSTRPPSTGTLTGAGSAVDVGSKGTVLSTPTSDTCNSAPAFDAKAFADSPGVDNPHLPLVPGTQFLLDGTVVGDDGKTHPHRIETTVTTLTKVIDGVRAVVIFDRDLENGVVQESEIYFEAQDRDGTVWNLGEYPEEYKDGKLSGAPRSWLPGVGGAQPGISMPAHPRTGTATYTEGIAPSVNFKDCATVVDASRHTCIRARCYDDVVVVDEYAPQQPGDGHQEKFMAPGVGTVRVAAAGGVDPEALELSSAVKLCPSDLATLTALAAQEDQRAYGVAKDLWAGTDAAAETLKAGTC